MDPTQAVGATRPCCGITVKPFRGEETSHTATDMRTASAAIPPTALLGVKVATAAAAAASLSCWVPTFLSFFSGWRQSCRPCASDAASSPSSHSSSRDNDDDKLAAVRVIVHHSHHPRVSIPRELPHDLGTRPFPAPIEPCTPEDSATMLRQVRKRRAYPLGACHRCKHGYPQAYLHAPMHIPASGADAFVRLPGLFPFPFPRRPFVDVIVTTVY